MRQAVLWVVRTRARTHATTVGWRGCVLASTRPVCPCAPADMLSCCHAAKVLSSRPRHTRHTGDVCANTVLRCRRLGVLAVARAMHPLVCEPGTAELPAKSNPGAWSGVSAPSNPTLFSSSFSLSLYLSFSRSLHTHSVVGLAARGSNRTTTTNTLLDFVFAAGIRNCWG